MSRVMSVLMALLAGFGVSARAEEGKTTLPTGLYEIKAKDIDGNEVKLEKFKGKSLLIVNVASKCGFTGQYASLQKLYERFQDQGFEILGFPSNDFGQQEPGTDREIKSFCSTNYGVTFPMFSKIAVKGKDIHPVYRFLTSDDTDPKFAGEITWNFNKFLIDRSGNIVNRFDSKIEPESEELVAAVEATLK